MTIARLSAFSPQLPPFDPNNIELFTYEAEIRRPLAEHAAKAKIDRLRLSSSNP